jgi:hypothetical protein
MYGKQHSSEAKYLIKFITPVEFQIIKLLLYSKYFYSLTLKTKNFKL